MFVVCSPSLTRFSLQPVPGAAFECLCRLIVLAAAEKIIDADGKLSLEEFQPYKDTIVGTGTAA